MSPRISMQDNYRKSTSNARCASSFVLVVSWFLSCNLIFTLCQKEEKVYVQWHHGHQLSNLKPTLIESLDPSLLLSVPNEPLKFQGIIRMTTFWAFLGQTGYLINTNRYKNMTQCALILHLLNATRFISFGVGVTFYVYLIGHFELLLG